ncbi:MAG: M23 family metallopeptidase [Chitinophagales bacterium]|nr:M23 family metallopeptidase [Bacteroidota bacterium]MCB9042790.1 M23 family metallopeptidase [Chitinophagales bacterium]
MKNTLLTTLFCLLFSTLQALSQENSVYSYPQNYFGNPLNIPLILAGNFGELRPNHFHAGIDIKTEGQEGLPVLAAAEGYVSRIKIEASGYGNALYITHPNGFTTVYAHLKSFNAAIATYVRQQQYQQQSFAIDITVPPNVLPVSKGAQIALSGNTGASLAPHLHFEIRDTYSEKAINPLLFNFPIQDTRPPVIKSIYLYAYNRFYQKKMPPTEVSILRDKNGQYRCKGDTIRVDADYFGVAVNAFDQQNAADNANGIYSIDLYEKELLCFEMEMHTFAFDETRYLNAHIDYAAYVEGKGMRHKCFSEAGDKLSMYGIRQNLGYIPLSPNEIVPIRLVLNDVAGNQTEIRFFVQKKFSTVSNDTNHTNSANGLPFCYYGTYNFYENDQIRVEFPPDVFYNDMALAYFSENTATSRFSAVHHIFDYTVPAHTYFNVSILPTRLPANLHEKALIVLKQKGRTYPLTDSHWEGEYLSGKARGFGEFYVDIDTIAPAIKAASTYANKKMSASSVMSFSISDNLSGIDTYNAYIDDAWTLASFDAKSASLKVTMPPELNAGKHRFRLEVSDYCGNRQVLKFDFLR